MLQKKKVEEEESKKNKEASDQSMKCEEVKNTAAESSAAVKGTSKGTSKGDEKEDSTAPSLSDLLTKAMVPPLINPNVFGKHTYTAASKDESDNVRQKDEQRTTELATYLRDRVIPIFLHEVKLSSTSFVDGAALVTTMHQRGINIRYLGHMASKWIESYNIGREHRRKVLQQQLLQSITPPTKLLGSDDAAASIGNKEAEAATLPKVIMSEEDDVRRSYFLRLVEIEMIARVVRHTISTLLRENSDIIVAPAIIIAKYLSRMTSRTGGFGYVQGGGKSGVVGSESFMGDGRGGGNSSNSNELQIPRATPASDHVLRAASKLLPLNARSMWRDIQRDVWSKFRYNLNVWPGNYEATGRKGIIVDVDRIALLRRTCQLVGISLRSREYHFQQEEPITSRDIHDMQPVSKHGFTKCQMKDVIELIEYGRTCLNQRQLHEAHVALQEALVYLYQAVGVMHEYVAVTCSLLAQCYHFGNNVPQAILFEQRALCLYERLKGFDAFQVIHSHNFLATLHSKVKNGEKMAAKHMVRYLYLQRMACGQYHSDMNNNLIKLGTIYQSVGRLDQAAKTYQYALQKSLPNSIDSATCLHLLAKAYHLSKRRKEALAHVRGVSLFSCFYFVFFIYFVLFISLFP